MSFYGLAQGQVVLQSNRPIVTADANCQGSSAMPLRTAALPAVAMAPTASPKAEPVGGISNDSESRQTAHRVNWSRISMTLERNDRNQPLTVSGGRPSPFAIGRNPAPRAALLNASPITSMPSRRRTSRSLGKRTCVFLHWRQRDRRGVRRSSLPLKRSKRGRAFPQGLSTPPQSGQIILPPSKPRSTSAESVPTIFITGAVLRTREEPLRSVKDEEGFFAFRPSAR